MNTVKLKNMRAGNIVGTKIVTTADGETRDVGAKDYHVLKGETGDFDMNSKAIQIAAFAGDLLPVDKKGEAWLKEIRPEFEKKRKVIEDRKKAAARKRAKDEKDLVKG